MRALVSRGPRAGLLRVVLAVAAASALRCAAADPAAPPLKACVDADDPPFSSLDTPDRGIDVGVAQALADRLGRPLQLVWVQVPRRGGLGRALREQLGGGACDAYLGVPQDREMARDLAGWRLAATAPYLALGYVLAAAPGAPAPGPTALGGARKVGAVSATPADLYLHRRHAARAPYPDNEALMAALASGEIDLALAWSPALARAARPRPAIGAAPSDDPGLRAALTVATRGADTALHAELQAAIEALRRDGRLEAIAAAHGLPRIDAL